MKIHLVLEGRVKDGGTFDEIDHTFHRVTSVYLDPVLARAACLEANRGFLRGTNLGTWADDFSQISSSRAQQIAEIVFPEDEVTDIWWFEEVIPMELSDKAMDLLIQHLDRMTLLYVVQEQELNCSAHEFVRALDNPI